MNKSVNLEKMCKDVLKLKSNGLVDETAQKQLKRFWKREIGEIGEGIDPIRFAYICIKGLDDVSFAFLKKPDLCEKDKNKLLQQYIAFENKSLFILLFKIAGDNNQELNELLDNYPKLIEPSSVYHVYKELDKLLAKVEVTTDLQVIVREYYGFNGNKPQALLTIYNQYKGILKDELGNEYGIDKLSLYLISIPVAIRNLLKEKGELAKLKKYIESCITRTEELENKMVLSRMLCQKALNGNKEAQFKVREIEQKVQHSIEKYERSLGIDVKRPGRTGRRIEPFELARMVTRNIALKYMLDEFNETEKVVKKLKQNYLLAYNTRLILLFWILIRNEGDLIEILNMKERKLSIFDVRELYKIIFHVLKSDLNQDELNFLSDCIGIPYMDVPDMEVIREPLTLCELEIKYSGKGWFNGKTNKSVESFMTKLFYRVVRCIYGTVNYAEGEAKLEILENSLIALLKCQMAPAKYITKEDCDTCCEYLRSIGLPADGYEYMEEYMA